MAKQWCEDRGRLGPSDEVKFGPHEGEPSPEQIVETANQILKGRHMHYRNGREAKNGDRIVSIGNIPGPDGKTWVPTIAAVGVLYDAKPGNDHCNGSIAPIQQPMTSACLCDCLHVDDVAEFLKEKGLDKRPAGK